MDTLDIPRLRLLNQGIAQPAFIDPVEAVAWFGAVQAQDYAAARWALGLRIRGGTDGAVEQAFERGDILRTHVLRPTWHFVTPADIRWMLALTAPRVHAYSAYYYRQMELDEPIFRQSNSVLEKALRDGRQLSRPELEDALRQAGILTNDLRFTYLIMHAELDGLLCSGPRRGNQFTYALLEERVPPARSLERDEALAELALRYFSSHGPATLQDFSWWSGLGSVDARAALEPVKPRFTHAELDGKTYWFTEPAAAVSPPGQDAYLLPNYDEYSVAYSDRASISVGIDLKKLDNRNNGLLNNIIVLDGQIAGNWKRSIRKNAVEVELTPYQPLSAPALQAITRAAEHYGAFLGLPVIMANRREIQ